VVGRNHLKMVLEPSGGGRQIEAIQFNVEPDQIPDQGETVRVAYRLDVNEFRGLRSPQLTVEYLERHASSK
jgi:single-stranded-DNA-specific exonuclease